MINTKEPNLINQFFSDIADLQTFRLTCSFRRKVTDDTLCSAYLKKINSEVWAYVLTYNEKIIGDFIRPLTKSEEEMELFNRGCKIIADWMRIYAKVDNPDLVPEDQLAFGSLTYHPTDDEDLDISPPEY
jgi:hypothetical protein